MYLMIKSLITEYGVLWAFNRALYSFKLWIMRVTPLHLKQCL